MRLGFDCEEIDHAQAALLLYGMYRSREENSSLNGLETWDRCNSYIRGAILKSSTVGEFVQQFCKKAQIGAIKPHYLKTDGAVKVESGGTMAVSDGLYNYQLEIFNNEKILDIFANEALYIIMLVRERLQREKEIFNYEVED